MDAQLTKLKLQAEANLFNLSGNPYPGRGIIAGLDDTGENLVQVYWIMGRSENSRNRIFEIGDNGRLFTEAADPSKVKDPSLIIYNAMLEAVLSNEVTFTAADEKMHVVSNGHQTDAIIESCGRTGVTFAGVMRCWTYEPDGPNFTPRITAVSQWHDNKPFIDMAILRKSPWSDACDRHFYELNDLGKGFGHCLTTYSGDGDPLPAFCGEPLLLPLVGGIEEIGWTYWSALNDDNKVSLAVKFIPRDGSSSEIGIHNKYTKV